MEKIKEALQKAKVATAQEQAEVIEVSNQIGDSKTNATESESNLEAISYTNTKVLQLDNAHLEKNRIIAVNRHDASATALNSLRTQILQKMYENNWKSIAVVSPTPGCGKTFIAINLAISIANQPNKTAMLVDFDLRRPRVAKYLGIEVDTSLNEFFNGGAEVDDIMVNLGIPRLVVLPTMTPVANSAETLSSTKTNEFIDEIYNRYESRVIIYDLPPTLNADDALIMMRKVDCVLVVVGSGIVKEKELEEAMHHVPKEKVLGVVLNKADSSTESYYY